MNETCCGVPEERWIDWHLKRLPEETAEAMTRHLAQCADCRFVHKQWAEWLSEEGEGANAVFPSAHVYRALRRQAIKQSLRHRLKRRPVWWISGAAVIVLLLIGVALRGLLPGPGVAEEAVLPPMTYAQMHVPEGAAMMARPDTKMVAVAPAYLPGTPESAGKRMVMVWMNGRTQELFVLLEGVLPADSRDIQAWGTIKQVQTNLGLLEFHRTQGHLYSHDRSLSDVEELAFTIEPKGGSLRPTAPETARVKLAPGP